MDIGATIEKSLPLISRAVALMSKAGKSIGDVASYDFRVAHNEYCDAIIRRYCRSRTFFARNEPQYLDEFYVPSAIIVGRGGRHGRADLTTLDIVTGPRTIITGTGGSGKTIFMRHLLLNSIENGMGYPVFIELRSLGESDYGDIEGAIAQFMIDHGFPLSEKYVKQSIVEGLLVIILDGFDEVPTAHRKKLEKSIKKMVATSQSRVVISSRPDLVLEGWDDFTTARIAPLDLEDACELLDKIKYDGEEETKQRFISSLREKLFRSHGYFLSNPLLLSIMLLTYGDSADIPTKFASFYEQAFAALFQKHDALKSGYRRERKTRLDLLEFARVFSAFCAVSYRAKKVKFSSLAALGFVKSAKAISGMPDLVADDFIDDSKQVACLLIEEGLDITFVHRSFQEYFAARFINEAPESLGRAYFKEITSDHIANSESVSLLLYEMNPHFVEENYLIPELNNIFGDKKSRRVSRVGWISFYLKMFKRLECDEDSINSYWIKDARLFSISSFMKRIVPKSSCERNLELTAELVDAHELGDVVLRDLPKRSAKLAAISQIPGEFGMDLYEAMRLELLAMESRSSMRQKAISKVFALN